jgi:hypothetical protein
MNNLLISPINNQIQDQYGFTVENTPMGEMRVVTPYRLAGATFQGTTKDTNFWTETLTVSGVVSQANNQVVLSTLTTNPNGNVSYRTVRTARYVGASANRFRGQIQIGDVGSVNNSRKWGSFDGTNGAYFELDGTTLYAVTSKTGTPTRVASSVWNGNTEVPTLTNCNTYEIYYSNKNVFFVINDVLMHKVTALTATWSDALTLPVWLSNTNSNGKQTNHTLTARVATIVRLGAELTEPIYKHIAGAVTTICKYGTGKLHSIIINSPGTLCTIYDNTAGSGTAVMAIIDTSKNTGVVSQATYNCPFFTGLTIVTTGAGTDVTVIYE